MLPFIESEALSSVDLHGKYSVVALCCSSDLWSVSIVSLPVDQSVKARIDDVIR